MVLAAIAFGRHEALRIAAVERNKPDVVFLKRLIEAGEFRPVIDRRYPMSEVVEAHRYVERGGRPAMSS